MVYTDQHPHIVIMVMNYLYYADCRGEDVQARINKGAGRRVSPYYFFDVTADDNFNITVWNNL